MLLSILIPTVESRTRVRGDLFRTLEHQASGKPVEILIENDNGLIPTGMKRQRLMMRAKGDYIAFVDCDDLVAPNYVAQILSAIDQGGPPLITFDIIQTAPEGRASFIEVRLGSAMTQLPNGVLTMGPTHIAAWRREIAMHMPWVSHLRAKDDWCWFRPLQESGIVRYEHHIDDYLYIYHRDCCQSEARKPEHLLHTLQWARGGVECYRIGNDIFVATQGGDHAENKTVQVHAPWGKVETIDRVEPFYVIRL
jgi:glycosyltransferase involved in cell wall biosynthesis